MHTDLLWGNIVENGPGKIILKWILGRQVVRIRNGR
jgi:hypothetical protein